jgi:hypothetical protein
MSEIPSTNTNTKESKEKKKKETVKTKNAKEKTTTKKDKKENTEVIDSNDSSTNIETNENASKLKKKGGKIIPRTIPEIPATITTEPSNLTTQPITNEFKDTNTATVSRTTENEPSSLPNVVVRLRCQLSDLNRPITEESQISNPYEYKAWIPSEIKTYNTTDYHSGTLSMEPIRFMRMEAGNGKGGSGDFLLPLNENVNSGSGRIAKEEGVENNENYAYLDAKWLHSGMMNKININDATPMLKQMIQPSSNSGETGSGVERKEVGKKRDGEGGVIQPVVPFMGGDSSEYSKAPVSKDIQNKLYQQKVLLYHGLVQHKKKSACFWCTCDYDTPVCAIPYYNVDGSLDGYGSFCRPECAVAYLYSEKLDDSVRADRDHLINFYYGKAYGYEKRIKPAPDPHYLLDKFFGNLTIQEYRKLLKSEHLLATLDKPMTRIFPELHEITDDFLIQIYGGDITLNRGYRVKRASEQVKGPSKMEILRDQFKKGVI